MSIESLRAKSRPIYRCRRRLSSSSLSTCEPHGSSASPSHQRCSPAPTRLSSDYAARVDGAPRWRSGRMAAAAQAQQAGSKHTVGILSAGGENAALNMVLIDVLRELGWVE